MLTNNNRSGRPIMSNNNRDSHIYIIIYFNLFINALSSVEGLA